MNTQRCFLIKIFVLRRYAKKDRENLKQGSISNQVLGADELKNKTYVLKPKARVKFLNSEMKPFNKFKELRKVEIEVDGLYLKTKMLEFVAMEKDADPKK